MSSDLFFESAASDREGSGFEISGLDLSSDFIFCKVISLTNSEIVDSVFEIESILIVSLFSNAGISIPLFLIRSLIYL